jgi:4-amino-4-deoxy-L-arabinose transferase-like glycosyltransferase
MQATLAKLPRLFWPVLACLACLLPFAHKAVHIDDPLFLWAARHIQNHPLDFYGSKVNWYGTTMPMHEAMENPPLCSYFIALAAGLFGWNEPALHLAFLIWPVGVIWGTYRLAERLTCRPLLAALVTLLTPVFLVSSTNLMCDTMMLCFWIWALVLWERGLVDQRWGLLAWAGVLVALCFLTKYFGVALVPLLLVYSLHRLYASEGKSRPGTSRNKELAVVIGAILIPVLTLAAYQWLTYSLYGRGLLIQAAATAVEWRVHSHNLSMFLAGLAFVGGCLISPVLFLPFLAPAKWILAALGGAVLLLLALWDLGVLKPLMRGVSSEKLFLLQLGIFFVGGLAVLALICQNLWRIRDSSSILLGLWALGTFVFASLVNWTVSGRTFLPLAPAMSLMIVRSLEQNPRAAVARFLRPAWMLLPAAVLSLMVTWADYRWAQSVRTATELLRTDPDIAGARGRIWFEGHWGFQYYLEQSGRRFVPVDLNDPRVNPGEDLMIIPVNNTNGHIPSVEVIAAVRQKSVPACSWLAVMKKSVGAGFYSVTVAGKLPFAFGSIEPDVYYVISFKKGDPRQQPQAAQSKLEKWKLETLVPRRRERL